MPNATIARTSRGTALRRAGAVLGAAAGAVAVWAAAGGHPRVEQGGQLQTVGAAAVIVTALLAGLAGWGLLAVLERTTSRPRLIWTVTALAVGTFSLLGPLTSGADAASSGTLVAIHLVVAAVLVPVFNATARR